MPEDFGKDISSSELDFMMISLIARKIKVLIVGGGKAGFVKAKAFSSRGCRVQVLSKTFIDDFNDLKYADKITRIKDQYRQSYIADHHIIVAATDDRRLNQLVKTHCEADSKLYLTCDDFTNGLFVVPVQRQTRRTQLAVHTRGGSPNTSVFLAKAMEKKIRNYDEFVNYVCELRKKLKHTPYKQEIMDFVNTDDFYECYALGVHTHVLKMFYGGDMIETQNSNTEE